MPGKAQMGKPQFYGFLRHCLRCIGSIAENCMGVKITCEHLLFSPFPAKSIQKMNIDLTQKRHRQEIKLCYYCNNQKPAAETAAADPFSGIISGTKY